MVPMTAHDTTAHDPPHGRCEHGGGTLDAARKKKLLDRLVRIEGQVRGIRRMIEEDRYCVDVLGQVSAIRESLRSTAAVLLEGHVRSCVRDAVASKDHERTEEIYDELIEVFNRFSR